MDPVFLFDRLLPVASALAAVALGGWIVSRRERRSHDLDAEIALDELEGNAWPDAKIRGQGWRPMMANLSRTRALLRRSGVSKKTLDRLSKATQAHFHAAQPGADDDGPIWSLDPDHPARVEMEAAVDLASRELRAIPPGRLLVRLRG